MQTSVIWTASFLCYPSWGGYNKKQQALAHTFCDPYAKDNKGCSRTRGNNATRSYRWNGEETWKERVRCRCEGWSRNAAVKRRSVSLTVFSSSSSYKQQSFLLFLLYSLQKNKKFKEEGRNAFFFFSLLLRYKLLYNFLAGVYKTRMADEQLFSCKAKCDDSS